MDKTAVMCEEEKIGGKLLRAAAAAAFSRLSAGTVCSLLLCVSAKVREMLVNVRPCGQLVVIRV